MFVVLFWGDFPLVWGLRWLFCSGGLRLFVWFDLLDYSFSFIVCSCLVGLILLIGLLINFVLCCFKAD